MSELKCHTCHTKARQGVSTDLDPGWIVECRWCAENSGRAKKSVRHCARCQVPIVVMNVPSAVRLICKDCAEKDVVLLDAEALSKEARKNYERMVAVSKQLEESEQQRQRLERNHQSGIKQAIAAAERQLEAKDEEISKLLTQLDTSEDDKLAARLKAKMVAQYGIEEREAIEALLMWAIRTNRFHLPTVVQDASTWVATLLDEYAAGVDV